MEKSSRSCISNNPMIDDSVGSHRDDKKKVSSEGEKKSFKDKKIRKPNLLKLAPRLMNGKTLPPVLPANVAQNSIKVNLTRSR